MLNKPTIRDTSWAFNSFPATLYHIFSELFPHNENELLPLASTNLQISQSGPKVLRIMEGPRFPCLWTAMESNKT